MCSNSMKKFQTIIKRTLFVAIVSIGIGVVALSYFFIANKAPFLYGRVEYHVPYNSAHELDVYYPTRRVYPKSPVLLFVHGGGWVTGIKESVNTNKFNGAFNMLRDAGYTIVSPSYTLARDGKSPFPDCIVNGYEAIDWVRRHADSLNVDLDNFGVMGESAGAQIAMMNAFVDPSQFGLEMEQFVADYVVDIYGPTDLNALYHSPTVDTVTQIVKKLPGSMQESFDLPKLLFGFEPGADSARTIAFTEKYSPSNYLSADLPPVLIVHGDVDLVVPFEQSKMLKASLDSLGVENEFHEMKGVHHAFAGVSKADRDSVQVWIAEFVKRQYNKN